MIRILEWRLMRVIILAGGLGSRLSEETESKPKPMVLIDDKPILWHIMQIFALQGITDFVIALGYKGEVISDWLSEISNKNTGRRFDVSMTFGESYRKSNSRVNLSIETLETGLESQTGGRILQCLHHYPKEKMMATYGDGLANVSIEKILMAHSQNGNLATVTAVRPAARFGFLEIKGSRVAHFGEKDQADSGWINGGFFVLEPGVANYIHDNREPFETGALPRLVKDQQLSAYKHLGFFKPMDTLREKIELSELAKQTPPPWLIGL